MALTLEQVKQFYSHQFVRLLESLPSQFLIDPRPVGVLEISYPVDTGIGALDLRITNKILYLERVSNGEVVGSVAIDLRNKKIGELPNETLLTGVSFTLTQDGIREQDLFALGLFDINASLDVGETITLYKPTNNLFTILRPFSWIFQDSNKNIDEGLTQLDVLKALDFFADYHGRFYNITRRNTEGDKDYTRRIIDDTLRPRENNKSLEVIIKNELDLEIVVKDLLPLTWQLHSRLMNDAYTVGGGLDPVNTYDASFLTGSQLVLGNFLPGNVYNSDNFLVTVPLLSLTQGGLATLRSTIEIHKAGGTRAFYEEQFDVVLTFADLTATSELVSPDYDFPDAGLFDVYLPAMSEAGLDEFNAWVELTTINTTTSSCYFLIDTPAPDWTVQATAMPGSRITGASVPIQYTVSCDPTVSTLTGLTLVTLANTIIDEEWN